MPMLSKGVEDVVGSDGAGALDHDMGVQHGAGADPDLVADDTEGTDLHLGSDLGT